LWILLLALAGALTVLMMGPDGGAVFGLRQPDFASLVVKIGWLVLISGAVIALFRERITHAIQIASVWIVIALLLVLGYTYRYELRDMADRVMAELMPGRAAGRGRTVELARSRGGEFQINTQINGARVPMVLDTGASSVVLTPEAAKAAGLPLEMIKYSVNIETANGRTRAAPVTLDRITVGGIVERSVPALIAQPGQLRTSLLGMSFLNRLHGWEVRGDRLVMRGSL
jgi:aspartyl protease family protein